MTNSVRKGKRGEREVVSLLRDLGIPAKRGRQFKGTYDSPDVEVIGDKTPLIEVKLRKRLNLYKALDKADQEAADHQVPMVFHRHDGDTRWVVSVYADHLDEFCDWWQGARE